MRLLILVFLVSVVGFAKGLTAPLTSKAMLESIEENGATKTRDLILKNRKLENSFLKGIASGEAEWLVVAAKMRKVSDAGFTEGILIAMSEALTKNPVPVLKLIGPEFPVDQICSVAFIEPSNAVVKRHVKAVEKALKPIQEGPEAALAKKCLTRVQDTDAVAKMTAKSVDKEIKSNGAKAVWEHLAEHDAKFDKVKNSLYGIQDMNWVRITAQLRPLMDDLHGAEIDRALTGVMELHPEAILPYFGHGFDVDRVCSVAHLDKKYAEATRESLVKALTPLESSAQKDIAQKCKKLIEKAN